MQKDTVILSIEEYNELRDFKKEIENGKTLILSTGFYGTKLFFYTKDEAIKLLIDASKDLEEENESLRKEKPTSQVKRMSIWQFLKWRKS